MSALSDPHPVPRDPGATPPNGDVDTASLWLHLMVDHQPGPHDLDGIAEDTAALASWHRGDHQEQQQRRSVVEEAAEVVRLARHHRRACPPVLREALDNLTIAVRQLENAGGHR